MLVGEWNLFLFGTYKLLCCLSSKNEMLDLDMSTPVEDEVTSDSDNEIVKRVQQGDKEAYNILVLRYQHKVCDIAFRYVGNYVDANDVAQEAFIRAYRALNNFRGESSFYTWLYRITSNTAKSFIEKNQKMRHAANIDDLEFELENSHDERSQLVTHESPDSLIESEELQQVINQTVKELPSDLKRAIILREVEDMSYEDIAQVMKTPIGTVRSRIFRARQFIEERLVQFSKGL